MDIVTYLQGENRRSIEIMNVLLELTEEKQQRNDMTALSWNEVKKRFRQTKPIPESTLYRMYRQCRDELEALGLVELIPINVSAADIRLTEQGIRVAKLISEFTHRITEEMQKNEKVKNT
jgi:hypothetical protein